MNEPFIFRVSDCYYIQASYPSPAEHRHFAAHLVFALERPFTALVNGKSVETAGIAIGSDVPHTILSEDPTSGGVHRRADPYEPLCEAHPLQGAPWRALDASVSSRVREAVARCTHGDGCGRRRCRNRAAARIAGRARSAEDPRVLEAAAYMKAAPALEQLTIREVARAVHLSPSRLTHLFRRDTGISPISIWRT